MRALRTLVPVVCLLALGVSGMAATGAVGPAGTQAYVVARGDNLTTIARRFGTSVPALARENGIDPNRVLYAGSRLVVPAPPRRGVDRAALVPLFRKWAGANRLAPELLMAATWYESGWQNDVVSPTGAVGIGQLMPNTAAFVREQLIGVRALDERVPEHNIRMSARYLSWLLQRAGGDEARALASYYQGPRSVETRGPLPETVRYVRGVQACQRVFRAGGFPPSS